MPLHPLSARFAAVADVYERGRPDYAPAVVGVIAAELGLAAGAPVLDLAAGTGKLTRALFAFGFDVVAVEPQEALREVVAADIGAERVREGFAEEIPLPEASMAAVTVADAFHWFDQTPALAEIGRVLRPGGGLAVLNTIPDWTGASWAGEVGELMAALRPEHPGFEGTPWRETVQTSGAWSQPRDVCVTVTQAAGRQRFLDYIASVSWMAALPEGERAERFAQIETAIAAGETPDEIPVQTTISLVSLL
jgi:SAM-dependent methyltransferase